MTPWLVFKYIIAVIAGVFGGTIAGAGLVLFLLIFIIFPLLDWLDLP